MQTILHECIMMLREYNKHHEGETQTRLVEHKLVDLQKQLGTPADYIPKRKAGEGWKEYYARIKN